mmetsp:Transcript_35346/g.105582  ORF Transcript_35346/g.105582 Transcript_35346/m.105582 type:complete len:84 (-) Transcript_35346:1555-1806(-)
MTYYPFDPLNSQVNRAALFGNVFVVVFGRSGTAVIASASVKGYRAYEEGGGSCTTDLLVSSGRFRPFRRFPLPAQPAAFPDGR